MSNNFKGDVVIIDNVFLFVIVLLFDVVVLFMLVLLLGFNVIVVLLTGVGFRLIVLSGFLYVSLYEFNSEGSE
jgi:hypothetical protein